MQEIHLGRASDGAFPPALLDDLYRFRHQVFRERLGWEVASRRGRERDGFDDLDPVHIAVRDRGRVIGCWRLLPTTGPYMLRDTFPQLLRGEPPPAASDVWELSRFAVEAPDGAQANCSAATFEMIRACHAFAVRNGIREFVTVTSVAVERMMRSAGIVLERFGDRRAERVGRVLTVACRVPVDDALARQLARRPAAAVVREVA